MRKRVSRGAMAALMLCAALSAFYLREEGADRVGAIPVERVFARVTVTQAPDYRQQRERQRAEEMAALTALAEKDETAAGALAELISRAENERAVEGALASLGHGEAVCVLRRRDAALYVREKLGGSDAQKIIEICSRIADIPPENVIILDECAYL